MENRKALILKVMFYVIYGLIFFILITIWRFPYNLLAKQLDDYIQRKTAGLSVKIEKISPSFPLGASFHNVDLGYKEKQVISFDLVKASLDIWPVTPILTRHYPLDFAANGPSAKLSGQTNFFRSAGERQIELRTKIERLDLIKLPVIKNLPKLTLSGIVRGNLQANLSLDDKMVNKGEIALDMPEGVFTDINLMGLKISRLDYERIVTSLVMEAGKISVKKMELLSKEFSINALGEILLNEKLPLSTLHLSLKIRPSAGLLKELGIPSVWLKRGRDKEGNFNLRLSGTISSPRVEF